MPGQRLLGQRQQREDGEREAGAAAKKLRVSGGAQVPETTMHLGFAWQSQLEACSLA